MIDRAAREMASISILWQDVAPHEAMLSGQPFSLISSRSLARMCKSVRDKTKACMQLLGKEQFRELRDYYRENPHHAL